MDTARIAELLVPFLAAPASASTQPGHPARLSAPQLDNISMYIDILLRWNARMNLTAVRQPDQIVTRHFGESLFAARHLFPDSHQRPATSGLDVIDVGSGAGFPGLPLKLWAPHIHLTLIESNHKKATFLREVVRKLTLSNVDVFADRAQDFPPAAAQVVTLRAVERFETALPAAVRLVAPGGRVALLIGRAQIDRVAELAPNLSWSAPAAVPLSSSRTLLVGS